jgi:hypothetical protein
MVVNKAFRHDVLLPSALLRLRWARIARRFNGTGVTFTDKDGCAIGVTPDRRYGWRTTWFDVDGAPCGHTCATTHEDAIANARAYGARHETMQVIPLRRTGDEGLSDNGEAA